MRYPIEDISPISPLTRGVNQGLDMYDKIIQAIFMPDALKMKQQMEQANLESKNLQNRYYPRLTESGLASEKMDRDFKNFQMNKPLTDAGQDLFDLQRAIQIYGADSDQVQMIKRGIALKAREASQRANYYQKLGDTIGLRYTPTDERELIAANLGKQGVPSEQIPNVLAANSAGSPLEDPYAGIGLMQGSALPAPNPLAAQPSINPLDTARAREEGDLVKSNVVKRGITNTQANQRLYSDILTDIIDRIDPDMESIKKFSGLSGLSGAKLDKALAAIGSSKTDPDYVKYDRFMHVDLPFGAKELNRAFAGQNTDFESKLMKDVFNPISWDSNPEIAQARWNRLKEMATNTRQKAYRNQSEMLNDFQRGYEGRNPLNAPKNPLTVSSEGLKKAAQLNPDFAKSAGISIQIPEFRSREEALAWLAQQPPEIRDYLKKKMQGGR